MDTFQKADILAQSARYDVCYYPCIEGGRAMNPKDPIDRLIYPASLPDGRITLLLKILLSNACENNCFYCVNRKDRDFKRVSFQPEELAKLFINLYRSRLVHGLFLSSAITSSVNQTMEGMIKTVEILRYKFRFPGYIHLKILPGAKFSYVERATQLADRVSLNLEAPSKERLSSITKKDFEKDLLLRMRWIKRLISDGKVRSKTQTTQFVVGASCESDYEILNTTEWLYKENLLFRTYFSAFQPIINTPLENHPPTPLLREHRLYQVDFLLRRYGFQLNEIVFDKDQNLPLDLDPKMAWALNHPERFPIEINSAEQEVLLKIPGIGKKTVDRIIKGRVKNRIRSYNELKRFGVILRRASPFILLNGKSPAIQLENPWRKARGF
ncbi:MAG: putative DNA modification/repair radical SAM protein [bacterium]|nr:putative DNA modification/repair radical SAM protein [bacterium]